MGNAHAYRGRLTPALIALALLALAVVRVRHGRRPRQRADDVHAVRQLPQHVGHPQQGRARVSRLYIRRICKLCRTVTPKATRRSRRCRQRARVATAACSIILAKATHASNACGTTPRLPRRPRRSTVVTTTITTAKVAPTTVTFGKKVKVSGAAGPAASLAGAKVAFKVERKVGTKWVKMKTGTATATATGAFTWSYKTAKKGAHRVTTSIAKTSTFTAKKVVKTFKVK